MAIRSKFQIAKDEPLRKQVTELYKQGLPIRVVADQVKKSRMWVWRVINDRLPNRFNK